MSLWAAILVIMLVMNQGTQWLGLRYLTDKRLEAIDSSRRFGADTSESGIDLPDRISRFEGGWSVQIRNVPIVLPYVLWAPFPWKANRIRDLAHRARGAGLVRGGGARRSWHCRSTGGRAGGSSSCRSCSPVGLVFVFSVIEGNVGTIYRHRVDVVPWRLPRSPRWAGLWLWSAWQSRRPRWRRSVRHRPGGGLT